MNIQKAILEASNILKKNKISSPSLDSEILLSKVINKNRVIDYLMFVDPKDGETFYNDVFKLPRSHILEYTDNNFSISKYFEFNINIKSKFKSDPLR